jgi:hypothetical protein
MNRGKTGERETGTRRQGDKVIVHFTFVILDFKLKSRGSANLKYKCEMNNLLDLQFSVFFVIMLYYAKYFTKNSCGNSDGWQWEMGE